MDGPEIVLAVTIHDTPAAIRMGGDGYLITFAGTEADKEKAAQLILMLKMELELVIRPKRGNACLTGSEQADENSNKDVVHSGAKRQSQWKAAEGSRAHKPTRKAPGRSNDVSK